jgi:hypothetical protein
MKRRWPAIAALALVVVSSCTPPPLRETPAEAALHPSRDNAFRYQLPPGWFDVSADSAQNARVSWIVRSDYKGTIFVREVFLDEAAKKGLARGGLLAIAKLTASLEAASKHGLLVQEPQSYGRTGIDACVYEVEERGDDRVRTVLLNVGGSLYAVSALVDRKLPEEFARQIFDAHDAFVAGLRW